MSTENGVQNAETETKTETEIVVTKKPSNAVHILDGYLDDDEDADIELKASDPTEKLLITTSTADPQKDLEDNTAFTLQHLDKKGKKSTAKSVMAFWKPKVVTTVQLSSRALALLDMATDINLLYKSQAAENGVLTVCLFLSLFAPYLLQYSCGIKLFTLNRTFDRLKGLKKILVVLFLMPCGVLFFILLDIFDVFFNFYLMFQLFFCCASLTDIQRVEEDIATQLGMDRMNWEGIKRQKKVSQLMFETIPQVSLQILMFSELIPGLELTTGISQMDVLLSACSAISNAVLEIIKLYIESKAVEEGFFNYALTCFMARVGWVPFRSRIRTFLENPTAKLAYISFNIRHMMVSVDFFFSTLTIQELIETLLIRPIKKDGYDSVLIIDFHESLRLLGVHSLVELMRTCAERHIFIKGLNDVDKVSWNDAVLQSMEGGADVRITSNSRDSQGTAHLMSIYKSEKALSTAWVSKQSYLKQLVKERKPKSKDKDFLNIAFFPTVFSQCIPLDFDVNVSSLLTGETLVFELIRHNDYINLWYLLNEYQTETNCDVYLDVRNKKGKSPLYYALRQYIRPRRSNTQRQKSHSPQIVTTPLPEEIELDTMNTKSSDMDIDTKMHMLLLKSNADANFPVLKRGGLTQSCLGYLLDEEQLEMMLEVIRFGAELSSKEIVKLAALFLPQSTTEPLGVWKQRKSVLIKICSKLKLPLDYIRNEHQCNPIHLLLRNETFYHHAELSLIIKELQNTSLIWMFQHDEFGNLPVVGILREHNPNIHVFKMVYDNAPTDYHRQRLVTILRGNRYSMGIFIYFIVAETRKLAQFISCAENKNIRNGLSAVFDIFGRDIRWIAKHHDRKNEDEDRIENKVDLSIVTVLNEGGLYFEDYMRYKIATKLRNEFNLRIDKEEERMIQKWNRSAHAKSLFKIETTVRLQNIEDGQQGHVSRVSTQIKSWLGHIDKQIARKITQRQKLQHFDSNLMDIQIQEIKEERTEDVERDDEARGTIIHLGDTVRLKTKKHVEDTTFKAIFWKRLELVYAFMVEGLSVMDLSSDIVILLQLLRSNNQWWTAWMLLFLLSPYLVSFCALASIFQSHEAVSGRQQLNTFVIVIFLSPLSILFLMLLDIVFMFYILFALILTLPLLMCCCNVSCVDSDWIFKLFGMTHMETKGYRRLRTLSQLLFETMPQILLQVRMLYALEIEGFDDTLSVSTNAVVFSVVIAVIHFVLEIVTISAEAGATKVSLFQYGINCLNARLNWVPLSHLLARHHREYQQRERQKALKNNKSQTDDSESVMSIEDCNVLNFENLTHRICKITYVVNFEFSSSAIRRLAGYVTRMQKYVDISSDDVKQIAALLPITHCTIPRIILGEKTCLNLNLSDLAVLYRHAAHRILIDGGHTLDWYYFVRRHFRKITKDKKRKGLEAQGEDVFDWKKAQFLLYDFLLHGELDAVHYIYQEIEDRGIDMVANVPVQTLKRNLFLAQNNGGIIKDIATLRRFWKNKYMFGLSCREAHLIYDVILRYYSKALTLYQSMNAKQRQRIESGDSNDDAYKQQENSTLADQYQGIINMILLILWYSQSAMVNHRCPECNIGWREYLDQKIKSQYRINIMKQLPEMVKIFVKTIQIDRSGIFNQNKKVETTIIPRTIIPFILCECSDRFASKIDEKILKDATGIGDKIFDFEGVEEGDDADIDRFTWSWLDIEGKESTGTYVEYEKEVNDEINARLEIALSAAPQLMQKQKTMEEEKILKKKEHEKALNIRLMKGKFGSEQYMSQKGEYYLKIDQSITPWRYYEICVENGVEISSKTKIIRRITEENSINMVILENSKSVSDKILANLNQRDIDMLSTVIQSKHDATSSFAIMKNLYQQGLLTDLLSTAVGLKLRHGYDQFLVAISRFFRKKTVEESDGHTGYYQKVNRITYTYPYRDIEDDSGLTVLGIESVCVVLRVKREDDDEFPEFEPVNSLIPRTQTQLSQQRNMDDDTKETTTASEKREIVVISLWMKIPKLDKAMLDDWNNVLITKQELYKSDFNKAIKFDCDLQNYYALGYFNPSLSGTNVDKYTKFYITTSRELNIETVQSKVRYIVNQTISESKFEKVNNKFVKEHNVSSWQYYFDGKWINYEQITCIQIDDDLKQLLKQRKQNDVNPVKTIIIPLKSGSYFTKSKHKNTYQIRIVLAQYPPRLYQLNVQTGHTRHVKQDPPFWLSLDEFTSFDESIYQNPYQIGWKYQCQRVTEDKEDDGDDEEDTRDRDSKYIYVDITTDVEEKENELSLKERIESAYQQRLKRFTFNDGYSDKSIHFNYNSIPHTFIEIDNEDSAEMRKVIRHEPLFLRRKGLDSDLVIKNGPYWELMTPCTMQQYKQLMVNARTIDDDDEDGDHLFDSFMEERDRTDAVRCLLCECNLERWEVLDHQLSGKGKQSTLKMKQRQYQEAIANSLVRKPYDTLCERIQHNTIVSISSECYFHAGCIAEHFENELRQNTIALKCPKTDKIVYDSVENELIGSPIHGQYAMIVNENEKTQQIQILFVFDDLISPITHAIKMDDAQLLQNYKDSFRRRLIRLNVDNGQRKIVYVGGDAKLINIFNKALPRKRNSTKKSIKHVAVADTVDEETEDAVLAALAEQVILQATVTYEDDDEIDVEAALDIAGMIDNELDLSDEDNDGNDDNKVQKEMLGNDLKVAIVIIESDEDKTDDNKTDNDATDVPCDAKNVQFAEKTVIEVHDDSEESEHNNEGCI